MPQRCMLTRTTPLTSLKKWCERLRITPLGGIWLNRGWCEPGSLPGDVRRSRPAGSMMRYLDELLRGPDHLVLPPETDPLLDSTSLVVRVQGRFLYLWV